MPGVLQCDIGNYADEGGDCDESRHRLALAVATGDKVSNGD